MTETIVVTSHFGSERLDPAKSRILYELSKSSQSKAVIKI